MNIVEVEGNHVSMLQPPLVLGLAEEIRKNLNSLNGGTHRMKMGTENY